VGRCKDKLDLVKNMAISLQQLEDDWLHYAPAGQRPLGGRRALSGFNYQLSLSLNSFIDKVLQGDTDAKMAFEGLSDLGELRGNLVYLAQAKLTLTTSALKAAIREFLEVDKFLEAKHKKIRNKVRYQVLSRSIKGTIRDDLSADELNLTPSDATRWKRIRSQVLKYKIQGDPWLELVIKLWNKVSKPFDFVASLRGDLLRLLAANTSSEKICEELLKKWQEQETKESSVGDLLNPSAFEDSALDDTRILVGQRPLLRHLTSGYFMEREDIVQKVLDVIHEAIYDFRVNNSGKIPIVWISGGSGVGKSVLLLQTMRKLTREYDIPVNFLRQFSDQLPKALHYWGQQAVNAVIAVDDLFAPDYRRQELWSEVNRLAYDAPYITILTCGPKDYREAFEQQAKRAGVLEVIRVDISPLDDIERERYREWYSERTQQVQVKAVKETNFVIAAFVLERNRYGDATIEEFTARLQQRLDVLGLTDSFLTSLAVNTLGIDSSMNLYDGQRDAITQLVEEGLCQVVETPEQQDFIRWFHPALAKRIYDLLVAPDKIEKRAFYLKNYFVAIIDDKNRTRSFLQLLEGGKKQIIPVDVARETLRQLWNVLKEQEPPDMTVALVFDWRTTVQKNGLIVEKILQPFRLRSWMNSPAMNPQGWGLLWQLLWDYLSSIERDKFKAETLKWLEEHFDLQEWNFIWQKLYAYDKTDRHLIDLAKVWLTEHSASLSWGYIFNALYDAGVRESWIQDVARLGLANSPVTIADKYLWERVGSLGLPLEEYLYLITKRLCRAPIPVVRVQGVTLIESNLLKINVDVLVKSLYESKDEVAFSYVFQMLLNILKHKFVTYRVSLAQIGRQWLSGREDRPDWTHVWRRLVDELPNDAELKEQGRQWLGGREDRPDWTHVWRRLIDELPNDAELKEQGRQWLGGREDRPDWTHVWRRLIDELPNDVELQKQGRQWLSGREDRPDWNYIWQRLVDELPNDVELQKQGRQWLSGREDRPDWTHVWQRLVDELPNDVELKEQSRQWLSGREDRPDWNYIWQRLVDELPNDAELQKQGREWLGGREDRPDWTHVWERLVDELPNDAELQKQGREWLGGREDRPDWNYIWQRLVDELPNDVELQKQGRQWLSGREDRPDWTHVWQRLVDELPNDVELKEQGRQWLSGREDRPDWNYIWQRLVDELPNDAELKEQGRQWLSGREDKPEYRYVKRKLEKYRRS
jgi:hypothetical protein